MSTTLQRHFLDLEGMSASALTHLLDRAQEYLLRLEEQHLLLHGRTVANLFFESSTRTRTSFETAEKKLGANALNFAVSTSSVSKGESLLDTARTIHALGADIVVIRHGSSGAPEFLARRMPELAVINAGDGTHAHPTQALLDLLTMRQEWGTITGKTVAIVGDIAHSRVARSNLWGLSILGARVRLIAPRTLMVNPVPGWNAECFDDLKEGIRSADAVMALRIQRERMTTHLLPSLREYSRRYLLTEELIARCAPDAIVLHPGPVNRAVEIDPALADGPRSRITAQVTNGIAARMAVLESLTTGGAA